MWYMPITLPQELVDSFQLSKVGDILKSDENKLFYNKMINEEILELPSQTSPNIKYKEQLSLVIFNFISFTNENLAKTKETRNLKLLIGGGAAFNYYIKRNKKTVDILSTHDFDLRLFLDIPPSKNHLFDDRKDETEQMMLSVSSAIAFAFADFLNKYLDEINITPYYFKAVERGFLSTVEYEINGEVDSLIDIVPHIPSKAIHYGALEIDKNILFKQYKEIDFTGVASRQGFFKSSLIYNRSDFGIYYVSLGYLVWDTVRMLNYIIDSVGYSKYDKTIKFERYLYKYKILLSALSRPDLYMTCASARKYISTCTKTINVCKVDGKAYRSKKSLLDVGIKKGIIPNTKKWYDAMIKMDFSDICKVVLER